MGISFEHSILSMSDLRTNLDKIRVQLKKTPVIITKDGRPEFGICDLETLEIAAHIKDLKDLIQKRLNHSHLSEEAELVFKRFEKYHGKDH